MTRIALSPAQRSALIEITAWVATACAIGVAGFVVLRGRAETAPSSVFALPSVPDEIKSVLHDEHVDTALELLSRETLATDEVASVSASLPSAGSAPFALPKPQLLSPSLRGIVWTPRVAAIIEGGGLPEGGGLLMLNAPRGDLNLTAVRGDTAFVRGRDTSWVLVLRSRNRPPQ